MGNGNRVTLVLLAAAALAAAPASAQSPSAHQPEAIQIQGISPPPCPRLGSANTIQPLRLQPGQVALKNRVGCLSAEDAVYGPDGCPIRFCGNTNLQLTLPGSTAQPPAP